MTKGVILIARNNSSIDYIKQAVFCADRIIRYLNIPVSLITDNISYLEKHYPTHPFDQLIEIDNTIDYTRKGYKDGLYSSTNLEFKNTARSNVYTLTPYNETIVMDTDYIISNDILNNCFDQTSDIMMYKDAVELSNWRDLSEFKYISPNSIDFYWATVVFFRKSEITETFFNLVTHIQQTYQHYRNVYQIKNGTFRNDFAFSIAVHIMNGHKSGNFIKQLPGTLYYITDRDICHSIDDTKFKFLVEKQDSSGYYPVTIANSSMHVINKFSLNRIIDELYS
jgi:hypothetical protein|tara:strand:- start:126 stop:968 length:843 start_codon:yes stop_codon:yes gene_type:complete